MRKTLAMAQVPRRESDGEFMVSHDSVPRPPIIARTGGGGTRLLIVWDREELGAENVRRTWMSTWMSIIPSSPKSADNARMPECPNTRIPECVRQKSPWTGTREPERVRRPKNGLLDESGPPGYSRIVRVVATASWLGIKENASPCNCRWSGSVNVRLQCGGPRGMVIEKTQSIR